MQWRLKQIEGGGGISLSEILIKKMFIVYGYV